ncbi:quinohemoprotein amine dehydrogenase, beta subunit [Pseudogulbenkiania sp. NH8B]|uniref:quinohemoprotein amine dehydrogenase subunit beta n=1 Tax=Pseudogulbenkiania sp. (strain NH8B) TaxID=748280 RepID=UPI0002279C97|nr:quinohemoprotein amine dehydrogenase subunit beta [Pseudogulbenkiania sp. NH8B]BAK77013.1 quinohemoprotein amine dehydrogenase, beta subunit [Pseudogulbenkiania sp. NH8B]
MSVKTIFKLAGLAMAFGTYVQPTLAASDLALQKGHEYLAVTNYPNNLHIIDAENDRLYKSCRLPDAFGPGTIQISPDKTRAYVLNNHYGDIYGVELDSCNVVFHATLSQQPTERARAIFSIGLSPDGKELYSIVNPTRMNRDNYVVETPRLQVYSTSAGLNAKPERSFPAPRQTTMLQAADDGSLFVVGADVYKMDPHSGKTEVNIPLRNWIRPLYSPPDVLYVWPQQRPQHTFNLLYTAARFKDEKMNPETADNVYGFIDINLANGKSELVDFAPITEVYFTGARSPKDSNLMYGVLNRLTKYDIKEKKLLQSASLDHSYYCLTINKAGNKLYLSGTFNDVAIFDADSLKKIGNVKLPGGDMAITTAQIFTR